MTTILDSWNCRGTPPAAHHLPAMAARVRNPKAKANQNRAHDHSLAHCEHAAACCLQKEQPAPPSPNSHAAGARPSHAIRASRFPARVPPPWLPPKVADPLTRGLPRARVEYCVNYIEIEVPVTASSHHPAREALVVGLTRCANKEKARDSSSQQVEPRVKQEHENSETGRRKRSNSTPKQQAGAAQPAALTCKDGSRVKGGIFNLAHSR